MGTSNKGISFKYKKIDGRYRPIIPIEISAKDSIVYEVLVDSGADICIFDAEVADVIGIEDLEKGEKFTFGGVTGKQETGYIHKVKISVQGCSYNAKVAFSRHISDSGYGIVGQKGFFDYFSVKFDYSAKTIVLRKKGWV